MIRKSHVPAALASSSLLILRNRLSDRIWGRRGVYSPHFGPPRPRPGPTPSPVTCSHRPRRGRSRSKLVHGVGVIGDSISDEYSHYAPDRATARNWVEILAEARGFTFGGPPTGAERWDRRFAHNWAQSEATTTSLLAAGQEAELARRAARGATINLVAVTIGTNDLAAALLSGRSAGAIASALERAVANFAAIFESLLRVATAPRIAAFTAVDLRPAPLLRGLMGSGLVTTRLAAAYGAAVAEFNRRKDRLVAAQPGRAVLVDIDDLLAGLVAARRYPVSGWELDRVGASNDPRHLFLADGFHPGTIGQCLIANRFLEAVNRGFGEGVPPLREAEMVQLAASVPRPTGLALVRSGLFALMGHGRRHPRPAWTLAANRPGDRIPAGRRLRRGVA